MIQTFTYDEQYFRTIPACIIDGRKGNSAVAVQPGYAIKAFTDNEVDKSSQPGVIPYKMETVNGNLVGYMSIKVDNGQPSLYQLWLREAFKVNSAQIISEIGIFIQGLDWQFDSLL